MTRLCYTIEPYSTGAIKGAMNANIRQLKIDQHRISIFDSSVSLVRALTSEILVDLEHCLHEKRHYYLSLAGGSTPKQLYSHLAKEENITAQHWQQLEVYFGDERYVPHEHAESNYKMAREAMLDHVSIPSRQIHPIPTDCGMVDDCVERYSASLCNVPMRNGFPNFDLMLLGMGEDGHTASLFPGTPVLTEQTRWIAAVDVAKFNSQRITLTYPVINHAKRIVVMVTGQGKAATIHRVMRDPDAHLPIQDIHIAGGIDWYLDAAAAAELS